MLRCFAVLLLCSTLGFAQYKFGVIVSQSGQAALMGQQQAKAIQTLQARGIDIVIRDDGSFAQETLEQAKDLIENQGVVALVCCTLSSNLEAISSYLETQKIVTISPTDLPTTSPWIFGTKPTLQRTLQSVLLKLSAKGQQSIGVMTPDTSLGFEVEQALGLLISPGGIRLGVLQKYPIDATVLTPEALWVATRLPETVLVWGSARDSAIAYKALRERGYERDIILNPQTLSSINLTEIEGASFVLSPGHVASSLPMTHPSYGQFTNQSFTTDAMYLYDAINLIKAGLEQVFTFGIPSNDIPALRYALRDALIGLGPYHGIAATYDYTDSNPIGIDPLSLVLGKVIQGRLVFQ